MKRQKELARQEKQRAKAARKLRLKAEKLAGISEPEPPQGDATSEPESPQGDVATEQQQEGNDSL